MSKTKTSLSASDVKHIAKLAQLGLTEEEVERYRKQLSEVVDYFNKLKKLDTLKTELTSQVVNLENIFREDIICPSMTQGEALSNAKDSYKGYFKVKAIFEE